MFQSGRWVDDNGVSDLLCSIFCLRCWILKKLPPFFLILRIPPSLSLSLARSLSSHWPSFGIWSWLEDQPLEGAQCQPCTMSIPTQRAAFVTSYFQGSKSLAFSLFVSGRGHFLMVALPPCCSSLWCTCCHCWPSHDGEPNVSVHRLIFELDPPYLHCCLDLFYFFYIAA